MDYEMERAALHLAKAAFHRSQITNGGINLIASEYAPSASWLPGRWGTRPGRRIGGMHVRLGASLGCCSRLDALLYRSLWIQVGIDVFKCVDTDTDSFKMLPTGDV